MGTWGTGLYQNDTAEDLKPLIAQLLKLPFSEDEIAAQVISEDEVSGEGWLILADQFEKRGIHHDATTRKALALIDNGTDIARLRSLDMNDADLRQRQKVLTELATRLRNPRPEKPRKTLKKAKPLPVTKGDVIAYPIEANGNGINPYFSAALLEKYGFTQTGWSVMQVVKTGLEFDLLPWIAVIVSAQTFAQQPDLQTATKAKFSRAAGFGTLSPSHFKKMGLVQLGTAPIPDNLLPAQLGAHNARSVVMSDVSIANALILKDHLLAS